MSSYGGSKFDLNRINQVLENYHQKINDLYLPKSVSNYEDFCRIPIMRDTELSHLMDHCLNQKILSNCVYITSSATSGTPKVLAQHLQYNPKLLNQGYYSDLLGAIQKSDMLNSHDVVVNLFSAGGMSTLFDGCNYMTSICGASLFPIGRLDDHKHMLSPYLRMMKKMGVNTILGTPSSMVQCIKAMQEEGITLDLTKLVYAGEMFTDVRRAYVRKIYPEIKIFGLYGQTETGILGINKPNCNQNFYHLVNDLFFIELTKDGEVLVSDFTKPLVPLFRYYVGDVAEFVTGECACSEKTSLLLLKGRCDKKFNFMANLISYEKVKNIVHNTLGKPIDFQVQLSSDNDGNDLLHIVLDDISTNIDSMKDSLVNALCQVSEINEGIQKQVAKIDILPQEHFTFSKRQKRPLVYDGR